VFPHFIDVGNLTYNQLSFLDITQIILTKKDRSELSISCKGLSEKTDYTE